MKGSICHVEIPADNLGALQGFYGNLFEWDFEKITGDMEYYNVKHGEEKPMGGMMARMSPDQKPTFYVCVDSSKEALRKGKGNGSHRNCSKDTGQGYGVVCGHDGPPAQCLRCVGIGRKGGLTASRRRRHRSILGQEYEQRDPRPSAKTLVG